MGAFDFLSFTNDWLEQYPATIVRSFDNYVQKGEEIAQSKVDVICTWLAWKVNVAIERQRQKVIKALYEMYKTTVGGKVMRVAMSIKNFVTDPIGSIGEFANSVASPIKSVFDWAAMLGKELPRLAKNLAYIAQALPPEPPSPHINYNKFKLKIGSISMSTITSDPSNLPSPESMFPEPPRPWSKETFQAEFDMRGVIEKPYYTMVDETKFESTLTEATQANEIIPDKI